MFTGLIQSTGTIRHINISNGEARLGICPQIPLRPYTQGESIAVNGACLTVEHFSGDMFQSFASQETLLHTNLGALRVGSIVNLEKAMRMGDSFGGHMVSGHVDCLCEVLDVRHAEHSKIVRFSTPPGYARQIIPKGSVTVDGVSLTVNACEPDFFEVNVIPATQRETTIASWGRGRLINLETDLIGKYVERMVRYYTDTPAAAAPPEKPGGLTLDFLRGNGF